jgi:flagellar biosynthesis/type III secretory pathway M-ring protein FliF/YscJ
VQRKRGKVSVSKRVDWKKVTQQSTKWEWRDDKNGGKLTWQSATNSKHENERRGMKEEGTRAREMLEEWHIHQPNNGNQEWCTTRRNRERDD